MFSYDWYEYEHEYSQYQGLGFRWDLGAPPSTQVQRATTFNSSMTAPLMCQKSRMKILEASLGEGRLVNAETSGC